MLQKAARKVLGSLGYDLVRRRASNGPQLPVLRILIEHFARPGEDAIVEIGANDGVRKDPVRDSILKLKLPALLVEPLPDIFDKLRAGYTGCNHVHLAQVAISNQSGDTEMFRVRPNAANLPAWVHGLASLEKRVVMKHATAEGVNYEAFVSAIESVTVPVLTVRRLLAQYPDFARPLMLQIDAEGHDFKIVQSAVDAGCLPHIINYEHKHLSLADQTACRDLLASHGYAFWSSKSDTLAVKVNPGFPVCRPPSADSCDGSLHEASL